MKTRARIRTDWRLGLYRTAFGFCRDEGFSLARLLAIPPEKLKLAAGEGARGTTVPVWLAPDLVSVIDQGFEDLARSFAPGTPAPPPLDVESPVGPLALEIASLDGRIDPRRAASWLARRGVALVAALQGTLAKALVLVGQAPGGEETALVVLLAVERALARAGALAAGQPGGGIAPVVGSFLLEKALVAAASGPGVNQASLGTRAGVRAALHASPLAIERDARLALGASLNGYRSAAGAFALAQAQLRKEADFEDPDGAVDTLATTILADPALVQACWEEAAADLLRESLAEAWLCVPLSPVSSQLVGAVVSNPVHARAAALEAGPRDRLAQAIARQSPPQAWEGAQVLLAELGDALRSRRPGELPEFAPGTGAVALATDWARGAYLAAADSAVLRISAGIDRAIDDRAGSEAETEWKAGARYRLGPGPEPLLQASRERREAFLRLDLRDFEARISRGNARALALQLRRDLAEPVLELAAKLRAQGGPESVVISGVSTSALELRGAPWALLELARQARAHVDSLRTAFDQAALEAISGDELQRLVEAEAERDRARAERTALAARVSQLEALDSPALGAARRKVAEAADRERELVEAVRARRERLLGGEISTSLHLAIGPAAASLAVESSFGQFPIVATPLAGEALGATARSPRLRALRQAWSRERPLAHHVSLAPFTELELEPLRAQALRAALASGSATDARRQLDALAAAWREELELTQGTRLTPVRESIELHSEGFTISGEALAALRSAAGPRLTFVERVVSVAELDPRLHSQFAFPPDLARERFVLALRGPERTLALLVRHLGPMPLRGAPVDLWEAFWPDDPYVVQLAAHHLPRWLAEP